jgi:hypothetical protein
VGGREQEWKALPTRWKQFMVRFLLRSSAQGVGVETAASKMVRRDFGGALRREL